MCAACDGDVWCQCQRGEERGHRKYISFFEDSSLTKPNVGLRK